MRWGLLCVNIVFINFLSMTVCKHLLLTKKIDLKKVFEGNLSTKSLWDQLECVIKVVLVHLFSCHWVRVVLFLFCGGLQLWNHASSLEDHNIITRPLFICSLDHDAFKRAFHCPYKEMAGRQENTLWFQKQISTTDPCVSFFLLFLLCLLVIHNQLWLFNHYRKRTHFWQ